MAARQQCASNLMTALLVELMYIAFAPTRGHSDHDPILPVLPAATWVGP